MSPGPIVTLPNPMPPAKLARQRQSRCAARHSSAAAVCLQQASLQVPPILQGLPGCNYQCLPQRNAEHLNVHVIKVCTTVTDRVLQWQCTMQCTVQCTVQCIVQCTAIKKSAGRAIAFPGMVWHGRYRCAHLNALPQDVHSCSGASGIGNNVFTQASCLLTVCMWMQAWIQQAADNMKLEDPNHMVTVGEEGFYGFGAPAASLATNPNSDSTG